MDRDRSFDVLRVSPGASLEEVEEAYEDMRQVWDPDRFPHDERLRKKVEEERRSIDLAYETIRRSHDGDEAGQASDGGAEGGASNAEQAGTGARTHGEARSSGEDGRDASSEEDWESRTLCGDGCCIGVIGPNGRCKECGRTVEEAREAEESRSRARPRSVDEEEEDGASPGEGVDLEDLRRRFAGTRYRDLVQYHLEREDAADLKRGGARAVAALPESVLPGLQTALEVWGESARDEALWETDAADVYDRMLETGRRLFLDCDEPPADEHLFHVFQVLVLSHAAAVAEDAGLRKVAGIA